MKAEEDRIAQDEKEKAFQDLLDKMTEEERYYYLKKLPTKEPLVNFPENQSIVFVKKTSEKFVELEEDINREKGCILEV